MPFGMWDGVGPSNHVWGVQIPPSEMGMSAFGIFNNMMRRFIALLQSLVIFILTEFLQLSRRSSYLKLNVFSIIVLQSDFQLELTVHVD